MILEQKTRTTAKQDFCFKPKKKHKSPCLSKPVHPEGTSQRFLWLSQLFAVNSQLNPTAQKNSARASSKDKRWNATWREESTRLKKMCQHCLSLLLNSAFAAFIATLHVSCGRVWLKTALSELCEKLFDRTYNTDGGEEKAILGFVVSALFAYHTAILFSHDTLEAGRLHITHELVQRLEVEY